MWVEGSMQQSQTSMASMAYPPPASPTLTNPDMILPYGESDDTYSPTSRPSGLPSPPHIWSDMTSMDLQYAIGSAHTTGPPTPLTPIIYGNGTMLSDIGEVTEAESTAGRKPRPTPLKFTNSNNSTATGSNTAAKRSKVGNHHRTISIDSTSTVTSEPRKAIFADFDDTVSVDDSVFQGDDEESVVEDPYAREYEMPAHLAQALSRKTSNVTATTIASDGFEEEGPEAEDKHSSGALSRRAEIILANAKKRLDTMEGNLSRARNSLYITPSSSMTSINSSSPLNRSTPSPGHPDGRIISQLGLPSSKFRQYDGGLPGSPGHSRVVSETSVPHIHRSLSAAGSRERLRFPVVPLQSSKSAQDVREEFKRSASLSKGNRGSPSLSVADGTQFQAPLETLSEDDTADLYPNGRGDVRSSTAEPYLFSSQSSSRSNSSLAMRDLRGQMQDLKGRISSLRDRAKEETLKRRSLQPLDTPSPFTAAEQWYATTRALQEETLTLTAGGAPAPFGLGITTLSNEPIEDSGDDRARDGFMQGYEPADGYGPRKVVEEVPADENDQNDEYDTATENEEYYDDDHQIEDYSDDGRESAASMYHDTHTTQVSHEDREDRFDYENFFLHSAMGSLSRQRAARRDSFASDDSAETTRGPETSYEQTSQFNPRRRGHSRHSSLNSVSTVATFATATEGLDSRFNSDYEEDDEIIEYPALQPPRPGSRIPQLQPPREVTPVSIKRSTFGSPVKEALANAQDQHTSSNVTKPYSPFNSRPSSVRRSASVNDHRSISAIQDPQGANLSGGPGRSGPGHRPSMSSFSSSGSARSFPLAGRSKPSTPVDTPKGFTFPGTSSPLRNSSSDDVSVRPKENGNVNGNENGNENANGDGARSGALKSVHMLSRDDQVLVEKLVASLGECVLNLQGVDAGSYEGRVFRRRLDAARRVLEGSEGAV